MRLLDVACSKCQVIFRDCLTKREADQKSMSMSEVGLDAEELAASCAAEEKCDGSQRFCAVLSVSRHGSHSSWKVE